MLDLLSAMDKVQVWSVITAQKLPLIYFFYRFIVNNCHNCVDNGVKWVNLQPYNQFEKIKTKIIVLGLKLNIKRNNRKMV